MFKAGAVHSHSLQWKRPGRRLTFEVSVVFAEMRGLKENIAMPERDVEITGMVLLNMQPAEAGLT